MSHSTRREVLRLMAAASLLGGNKGWAKPLLSEKKVAVPATDWSKGMIETTMHRTPEGADLGAWGYAVSLYLYGQYLFYKRTSERKHLDYIQSWVDRHVNEQGVIDRSITALDYMLPGNLLLEIGRAHV